MSDYKYVTDDDIKKAEKYSQALNELKYAVQGVNSKLPEFSNGLRAGLVAIGEKLPDVVESITKLNAQNKELAASGQKPQSVLKQLASSMLSWNGLISAGITLLATYGDTIIEWVSELLKGKTALSSVGKQMKDNAIITKGLIETQLKGRQNAQSELTSLTMLYKATLNRNLSLEKQKEALAALRAQWPSTFKNLSDETILTGKASKEYKNLREQILATAYAEAAKNRITENSSRIVSNELAVVNEQKKILEINRNINTLELHKSKAQWGRVKIADDNEIKKLDKQRDVIKQVINAFYTDTTILNRQNNDLINKVTKYTEQFGTQVITGAKITTEQVEEVTSKSSQSQIKQISKVTDHQKKVNDKHFAYTVQVIGKAALAEKELYISEQLALNEQYDKKLISQAEYYERSEKLEQKYHLGIGNMLQRMNEDELENIKKQQQAILDAKSQNEILSKDEQAIKGSIFPADRLAAEKQLITDKYDFEIQKAAEAGQDTLAIRQEYEQQITLLTQQYEQDRKQFTLQTAQDVSNAAFSVISNNIQAQSNAKLQALDDDKQKELSNRSLTNSQKQAIEQKYKQKENQLKAKAFKDEQKLSLAQALINGALAITKATAQTGILAPFVIPAIIASTAIQVGSILAQKPPAFAKGGYFASDGRGALLPGYSRTDNTNAYLRSGEAVVVSEAMRNPWARNLVSAINVAYGGRDFSTTTMSGAYAMGGVFTDGGNAGRYYSQPVNDVKELANTLAYQMINNFPPVYVDVKDINSQQSILARTIDRVNI